MTFKTQPLLFSKKLHKFLSTAKQEEIGVFVFVELTSTEKQEENEICRNQIFQKKNPEIYIPL